MPIKQITIPGAGESVNLPLTGAAIEVIDAAEYDTISDVPSISFNTEGRVDTLAFLGAKKNAPGGKFNRLYVTGSAAAEGDTITVLTYESCLDNEEASADYSSRLQATYKNSFTKVLGNTPEKLDISTDLTFNGQLPIAMYIEVNAESAGSNESGLLWMYNDGSGTSPDNSSDPIVGNSLRGGANYPLEIKGINLIENFEFCSRITGEAPLMIVTLEYLA